MKIKVKKRYIDRETREKHHPGEILDYSPGRGKEIIQKGHAVEYKEKRKKAK